MFSLTKIPSLKEVWRDKVCLFFFTLCKCFFNQGIFLLFFFFVFSGISYFQYMGWGPFQGNFVEGSFGCYQRGKTCRKIQSDRRIHSQYSGTGSGLYSMHSASLNWNSGFWWWRWIFLSDMRMIMSQNFVHLLGIS